MNCYSLTSLDLHTFQTNKVFDMSYMFKNCTGITYLNLENFDTAKVTNMRQMFSSCSNMETLDIRNFDTYSVIDYDQIFDSCEVLTIMINYAKFKYFYSLIPDYVKIMNVSSLH